MKLGYMMLMVAVGAMLLFAPVAMAAGKGGDKGHGDKNAVIGVVKEVKADAIVVTTKDNAEKTIAITKDTKVVAGGKGEEKEATVKAGDRVAVTLDKDGAAAKITIIPAHEKKPK
jgi:hypothetical protein